MPLKIIKSVKRIDEAYLKIQRSRYFSKLRVNIDEHASIICNNCFGGRIPQDLGYRYNSPFAGLMIVDDEDYITFLENMRGFTEAPLKFKSSSKLAKIKKETYPIGSLEFCGKEVEIQFVHSQDEDEARTKWESRKSRINFDNLVVIFTGNYKTTIETINRFLSLDYERKGFFSVKDHQIIDKNYQYITETAKTHGIAPYAEAHIIYKYLVRLPWIK